MEHVIESGAERPLILTSLARPDIVLGFQVASMSGAGPFAAGVLLVRDHEQQALGPVLRRFFDAKVSWALPFNCCCCLRNRRQMYLRLFAFQLWFSLPLFSLPLLCPPHLALFLFWGGGGGWVIICHSDNLQFDSLPL